MDKSIKVNDEAKLQRRSQLILSGCMFVSNTTLFLSKLNETQTFLFFLFLFLSICFLIFFLFYLLKVDDCNEISIEDIMYLDTKRILFFPFRYLKLKNNRIRIINFKSNSNQLKLFLNFLEKENVRIKD